LTIFNFGYFQAKFLNGFQEEEQEQEQHIDCIDLAIKKTSNIISKLNDDFSKNFCRSKDKDFRKSS
jgi:hypothetical protein